MWGNTMLEAVVAMDTCSVDECHPGLPKACGMQDTLKQVVIGSRRARVRTRIH